MNLSEVRQQILEIASAYFTGATVLFTKQSGRTAPASPLVTLTFGTINRTVQPITEVVDGYYVASHPMSVRLQVDLYTKGKAVPIPSGSEAPMDNTATDDLSGFLNFLDSPYVTRICHDADISIISTGSVMDVSDMIGDISYRYRAMAELIVSYTQTTVGDAELLKATSIKPDGTVVPDYEQTASSGGSQEIAEAENAYFTEVKIEEGQEE